MWNDVKLYSDRIVEDNPKAKEEIEAVVEYVTNYSKTHNAFSIILYMFFIIIGYLVKLIYK